MIYLKLRTDFCNTFLQPCFISPNIPVIFQVASLLAALAHPGHIVTYAPGDSLPCRRDAS
ncbi:hypothetical protein C6H66_06915 [Photorhabdus hindustanensis]|uniref:Uncharacterized protein n=1 Tax=Photorhabdus hindustanensis TaxID=2918802 RepID=A0A2S8Q521_9GAMM|nr:hypothetical protein C6H66_06915 [Photorhabdus hindustanensis]